MDEPTNYLDVGGLAWLESWLQGFRGGLIVVSHDRHFLDSVATRIVELENHHFQEYQGNFTEYVREKRIRLKRLENQFRHEEELLAFEAEAIADRREALRDPSNALKRRLANIKRRSEPRPVDKVVTQLYGGMKISNVLCRVDGIGKAYDDEILFMDVEFDLMRGDRLAIL
jgi:ATP-binding cassette subfamily F protein 3